jgi:hypothetical protein
MRLGGISKKVPGQEMYLKSNITKNCSVADTLKILSFSSHTLPAFIKTFKTYLDATVSDPLQHNLQSLELLLHR